MVLSNLEELFLTSDELSLTVLRNWWLSRVCTISDFLRYLVEYQGTIIKFIFYILGLPIFIFINVSDVPQTIPGEPVIIDSGRNWVTLSWSKPNHQSSPVIAYRVEAWHKGGDGGARWIELGITPRTTFDAFNLKPDAEYKFRVTPRNRYGWGESTASSTFVIGKSIELPEFVKILPGQLKALIGSDVTMECEVRKQQVITMKSDGSFVG